MRKLLLPLFLLISACSQPPQEPQQPAPGTVGAVNIIPKPQSIKPSGGPFELTRETPLVAADDPAVRVASVFKKMLEENYEISLNVGGPVEGKPAIVFSTEPDAGESEKYTLEIEPNSIRISGGERGMFYGVQSLFQLLPVAKADTMTVPAAKITDGPRFKYRGAHLDVSRHPMPVDFVKKYIRLMSRYKVNYFHWHLTDDQGWRIEIKKYPLLTEKGSKRPETVVDKNYQPYKGDGVPVEGFYTQDEIKDIVAYAKEHYVTIIPEIDMPAHSSSALAAYPEYGCKGANYPYKVQTKWTEPPDGFQDVLCPTPQTIAFLRDVLGEVIDLFPDSPYVHIGGDETNLVQWTESDAVNAIKAEHGLADNRAVLRWFIGEIGKFVASRGKKLICWDDVVDQGQATDAVIMFWDTRQKDPRIASADHEVIMTPFDTAYLDHPQAPDEPGSVRDAITLREVYMFEPVQPGMKPVNVIGGQACLWTEFIKTEERAEYMAYPRMLAMAEVLWSRLDPPEIVAKPPANTVPSSTASPTPTSVRVSGPQKIREFEDFTQRLSYEFARLDRENVKYRLPEPYGGIRGVPGGKPVLDLAPPIPGGKIYYTLGGAEPSEVSEPYRGRTPLDVKPGETIEVKAIVVTPERGKGAIGRYEFTQPLR